MDSVGADSVVSSTTPAVITPQPAAAGGQEGADSLLHAELDADDARPEAVFRYTVEKFSSVRESVLSGPCMVRNLPWKIMIMPRPNTQQQQQQQNQAGGGGGANTKSMGYFLQCNGKAGSPMTVLDRSYGAQ